MATLYELTSEYTRLLDALECAEDDVEAESIWEQIDLLDGDIQQKADAYARMMRVKQAEAEGFKAEKQRLAECQQRAEKTVDRLKTRMLEMMQVLNLTEVSTGIGKWRVQLNPWSCNVWDADGVPMDYHVPQPDKIDKAAILKNFKVTGEIPPGVDIIREPGVRFR